MNLGSERVKCRSILRVEVLHSIKPGESSEPLSAVRVADQESPFRDIESSARKGGCLLDQPWLGLSLACPNSGRLQSFLLARLRPNGAQ